MPADRRRRRRSPRRRSLRCRRPCISPRPTAAQIQTYARNQYQALATVIQSYSDAQGTFVLAGDAQSIATYASVALTNADFTTFQNLTVTYGSVTNGVVTLTTAGLAQFRS